VYIKLLLFADKQVQSLDTNIWNMYSVVLLLICWLIFQYANCLICLEVHAISCVMCMNECLNKCV